MSCSERYIMMLLYRSSEWKSMSDEEKESLGMNFEHDGEFWSVYLYVHKQSKTEQSNEI